MGAQDEAACVMQLTDEFTAMYSNRVNLERTYSQQASFHVLCQDGTTKRTSALDLRAKLTGFDHNLGRNALPAVVFADFPASVKQVTFCVDGVVLSLCTCKDMEQVCAFVVCGYVPSLDKVVGFYYCLIRGDRSAFVVVNRPVGGFHGASAWPETATAMLSLEAKNRRMLDVGTKVYRDSEQLQFVAQDDLSDLAWGQFGVRVSATAALDNGVGHAAVQQALQALLVKAKEHCPTGDAAQLLPKRQYVEAAIAQCRRQSHTLVAKVALTSGANHQVSMDMLDARECAWEV